MLIIKKNHLCIRAEMIFYVIFAKNMRLNGWKIGKSEDFTAMHSDKNMGMTGFDSV